MLTSQMKTGDKPDEIFYLVLAQVLLALRIGKRYSFDDGKWTLYCVLNLYVNPLVFLFHMHCLQNFLAQMFIVVFSFVVF